MYDRCNGTPLFSLIIHAMCECFIGMFIYMLKTMLLSVFLVHVHFLTLNSPKSYLKKDSFPDNFRTLKILLQTPLTIQRILESHSIIERLRGTRLRSLQSFMWKLLLFYCKFSERITFCVVAVAS